MSVILRATSVAVRQEGTSVVVIREGQAVFDMPWDAALALARAIYTQAKRAEELAQADAIAGDQAILLRLEVPLGLSDRRDIQVEAQKRAAWDSDLRRYIRGRRAKGVSGVRSREAVGTPIVRNEKGR